MAMKKPTKKTPRQEYVDAYGAAVSANYSKSGSKSPSAGTRTTTAYKRFDKAFVELNKKKTTVKAPKKKK